MKLTLSDNILHNFKYRDIYIMKQILFQAPCFRAIRTVIVFGNKKKGEFATPLFYFQQSTSCLNKKVFIIMKYIISESQYKRFNENIDIETNIIGQPSDEVLIVADFLNRYDIVEPGKMLIEDQAIQIFGFEGKEFQFFDDEFLIFIIYPNKGDIWINVEWAEDDTIDPEQLNEVLNYVKELSGNYSMFYWAIEGEPI
jgi:hypothetical protein